MKRIILAILPLTLCFACSSFSGRNLNDRPPALIDMEEPLSFRDEPQDEEARQALPKRAFSGVVPGESGRSMEELFDPEPGLLVEDVIENSPAAFAGLEKGDLLLEARPTGGEALALRWPSEWHAIEEGNDPGTAVEILYDRAGRERETSLRLVERHAPGSRLPVDRFREEERVGLVLRSATEVEAAGAGLPAGAGAVVVGLSKRSPWRASGVVFGDLLVKVGDREVLHPQVVLDQIRAADPDAELALELRREGEPVSLDVPISERVGEFTDLDIPLLFSYESRGERSDISLLYGLLGYEETAAEWQFTLLWFIHFGGGDTDELEEVEN